MSIYVCFALLNLRIYLPNLLTLPKLLVDGGTSVSTYILCTCIGKNRLVMYLDFKDHDLQIFFINREAQIFFALYQY